MDLTRRATIPQPLALLAHVFAMRKGRLTANLLFGFLLTIVSLVFIAGCAERGQPHFPQTGRRVTLPPTGEVELHAEPVTTIDGVLLAKMSVRNLTERQRSLKESGIAAITEKGVRVNELGLNDPAVVGNGQALFRAIGGSAVAAGGENEGLLSAGDWIAMMLVMAPIGEFILMKGMASDYRQPYSVRLEHYQIEIHLIKFTYSKGELAKGEEVTGYFFLPNRSYKALELSLDNLLSGNEEVMTIPWSVPPATAARSSTAGQAALK